MLLAAIVRKVRATEMAGQPKRLHINPLRGPASLPVALHPDKI